ncbi:MAG: hypothetical protein ACYSSO_03380 [Planctomycetota bacterium]|jgi:hypothetical protein
MGGWRSKLVFLLVVYFAGFATAVYCLASVPENQASQPDEKGFGYSVLKSDEFALSFNTGMHKCVDFVKDIAQQAGSFLNQKTDLEDRAGS